MVSTRSMERMTEADQTMLLLSLQREMAEMRRKAEEAAQKNEQELQALRRENEDMRKKLGEGGPSVIPTNVVGKSYTSPPNPDVAEGTRGRPPPRETEMGDESCLIRSTRTTLTADPNRRHPFTNNIIEVPLPEKWKGFNRDRYDGSTDPDEHMDAYTTHMSLYTSDDAVLCRVFPTSLKGAALSWFTKLSPNSIDSFATLVAKFETQFATSRPHHLTSIALVGIRQEKGESLRAFVDRFSKVAMSIRNLSPDVAMHHMLTALRPGPFADNLCMQPADSLDELRKRAAKYMQLEELREFRNQARAEAGGERKEEKDRQVRPIQRTDRRWENRDRPIRFSRYTPLTAERGRILDEALNAELIPPPRKVASPNNADRRKQCRYHQNTGHSTDECQALKDKIEELIQAGHLCRFVRNGRDQPGRADPPRRTRSPHRGRENQNNIGDRQPARADPPRRDDPPREADRRGNREVINTIAGGFAGGGSTNNARKKHLRAVHQVNIVAFRPRMPPITFTDDDFKSVDYRQQDDPMVIAVNIDRFTIRKTLVNQGSSVDILYWKTFKAMRMTEAEMMPYDDHVVGFSGKKGGHQGVYRLVHHLRRGEEHQNHQNPTGDILTVHVDQKEARECYAESLWVEPLRTDTSPLRARKSSRKDRSPRKDQPREAQPTVALVDLDPRATEERLEAREELRRVPLLDEEHSTAVGTVLAAAEAEVMHAALKKNVDMFAWTPADMPGVSPDVITHRLSIFKEARPISQKKRDLGDEKRLAAKEEAGKLLSAGFIREARYTTWLANVVMVTKPNVDYRNINSACPKDTYPLPNIDRLVDGAAGHKIMSFLDAYSSYNQISMHPRDKEKTAFMTADANYYYEVMPFGLKNAGATYQRLMDKIFKGLISRAVEVYVDNIVVKSDSFEQHLKDLDEVFKALRGVNMKLNPEKCTFGVEGGKFLGFMLTHRGIEANPDKCQAILSMRSPNTVKEVQQLLGRLTALSRFVPRLAEKTRPIVQLLRKGKKFIWDDQCEEIFKKFKEFLTSQAVIQKPRPNIPILVYLAVSEEAVSAALVQEAEGEERPIYFVSRTLHSAETRYQMIEKVALALVLTARRMRPYFQNHSITVRTDYPIFKILSKPDLAGRMIGWSVELSEFDIRYEPRGAIKSQCLVDFSAELTPLPTLSAGWTLYVDGSSNKTACGAGVVLEGPGDLLLEQALQFGFRATNNQAEYEALLAGLNLAYDMGAREVTCKSDSQVMVGQVNGDFEVKEPLLQRYYHAAKNSIARFSKAPLQHIPREDNKRADILSKLSVAKKKSH
ncbi:uncharacterized protein [Phaseolus vulgaris]|uniref:uncharacterized protein n=1 Tax=Phaseolus vulgaris TaxID=3885 RepID=UPI0035CACF67